jgi:hypothetical protein
MEEPENFVDLEDMKKLETKLISPTEIEKEISTT